MELCEPRSLPLPVVTVDKRITRLVLQLRSVDIAHSWLADWNLAFLEWRASCQPLSIPPVSSGSGTLANTSTLSGSQPKVSGSPRVVCHQSLGTILLTFEEAIELTIQQTSSASILVSVQNTFVSSQLSSVSILWTSQTAGVLPSMLPSISSTVSPLMVEAGLAMLDHRDMVVSSPSDASELLVVSEHTEEVETTHTDPIT